MAGHHASYSPLHCGDLAQLCEEEGGAQESNLRTAHRVIRLAVSKSIAYSSNIGICSEPTTAPSQQRWVETG